MTEGIISGIDLRVLFLRVKLTPSVLVTGAATLEVASIENEAALAERLVKQA